MARCNVELSERGNTGLGRIDTPGSLVEIAQDRQCDAVDESIHDEIMSL
jgi:hypothetical protein